VSDDRITLEDVSKFYGDVLGVNRVNLAIPSGITSLVGPNGSGKSTLMNLITGLLQPTRGRIRVLEIPPDRPEALFHQVGYCAQFDSFPRGLTGYEFLYAFLRLRDCGHAEAEKLAVEALERVSLVDAAHRKIAAYSKGMRQRIKLAQAICRRPRVLVLDEPLNGLDPMARAETIALFRELAAEGRHLILSSHILHEVDAISDQVVLVSNGYVVAEGQIQGVRQEVPDHPVQIFVRCDQPEKLAARVFEHNHAVEAKLLDDGRGLLVRTRDADGFYLLLNRAVVEFGLNVETVAPADDDVRSVYEYLIGSEGGSL
jgi:ABC-2 type transport system ATP-binding protein